VLITRLGPCALRDLRWEIAGSGGASFDDALYGLLLSEDEGFQDRRNSQDDAQLVTYFDSEALVLCTFQNDVANSFDQSTDRLFVRCIGVGQIYPFIVCRDGPIRSEIKEITCHPSLMHLASPSFLGRDLTEPQIKM
jgi:hypothetical protein